MTAVALALAVHLAALVAALQLPWSREDLAIARSLTVPASSAGVRARERLASARITLAPVLGVRRSSG